MACSKTPFIEDPFILRADDVSPINIGVLHRAAIVIQGFPKMQSCSQPAEALHS